MAHADDDGLVLPPRVAPQQIVILPVTPKEDTRGDVLRDGGQPSPKRWPRGRSTASPSASTSTSATSAAESKSWEWIKKGVPVRIEIGPRDLEKGTVAVSRRDRGPKDKEFLPIDEFVARARALLQDIQDGLLAGATAHRDAHTVRIDSKDEFHAFFTPQNAEKPEIHGGFALAHWAGSAEDEESLKNDLKVTIRCIPRDGEEEDGVCFFTGKPSRKRLVFAKAY